MLNIYVEGIEESVGAIEISGDGATLTDIRGVRRLLIVPSATYCTAVWHRLSVSLTTQTGHSLIIQSSKLSRTKGIYTEQHSPG